MQGCGVLVRGDVWGVGAWCVRREPNGRHGGVVGVCGSALVW
jgi:hypothetical protein